MRYFSSGIVPVGINKCMNENAAKIDKPKSIQEIIADLTEEDLTAISQLNLIRLLVKGMQSDDVNLKAQDQLVGDFMQYANALRYVITLQTRIVPLGLRPEKWSSLKYGFCA